MESFAKAPEPVSVEPKLRLQALRTQLTKSLLAIYSPYTSSIEKQDRRHRKARHRKLMECAAHINEDQHEMRIKRTLKTIRAFDRATMLSSVRNLTPATGANREHQHTRHNKTAHQVPEPRAEVMSASNQITHHQRSDKSAKVSDRINQPDRGRCGRAARKRSGCTR